ncbi:hypothetical protein F2Q69_00043998 [Brassica cretica]|uniref:Uncharacterized protein n=1 Tax=Brassica cretica TaxID=69181 RepID=A0A8S9NKA4_BRACR|nr:hypothetical protein F2Q69_00043998 [Brassica cretica]
MLNKIQNQRSSEEIRTRIPWILWFIWKARNDMVFELKEISPMEIQHSATLEAASKSLAYVVSAVTEENESPLVVEHRTIPSRPFCRFDASWKDADTRYVEAHDLIPSQLDPETLSQPAHDRRLDSARDNSLFPFVIRRSQLQLAFPIQARTARDTFQL